MLAEANKLKLYFFKAGEEVVLIPHVAVEAAHHHTGAGSGLPHLGDTIGKEVGVPLCLLCPNLVVQVLHQLNVKVPPRN